MKLIIKVNQIGTFNFFLLFTQVQQN